MEADRLYEMRRAMADGRKGVRPPVVVVPAWMDALFVTVATAPRITPLVVPPMDEPRVIGGDTKRAAIGFVCDMGASDPVLCVPGTDPDADGFPLRPSVGYLWFDLFRFMSLVTGPWRLTAPAQSSVTLIEIMRQ